MGVRKQGASVSVSPPGKVSCEADPARHDHCSFIAHRYWTASRASMAGTSTPVPRPLIRTIAERFKAESYQ
jgi:hypothetical protein